MFSVKFTDDCIDYIYTYQSMMADTRQLVVGLGSITLWLVVKPRVKQWLIENRQQP